MHKKTRRKKMSRIETMIREMKTMNDRSVWKEGKNHCHHSA